MSPTVSLIPAIIVSHKQHQPDVTYKTLLGIQIQKAFEVLLMLKTEIEDINCTAYSFSLSI